MKMNRFGRLAMVAATVLVFAGCSEARLDATSESTLEASAEKVMKSLTPQKREEFTEALSLVVFSQAQQINFEQMMTEGPGRAQNQIRQAIDGKTADEVIAAANRLRAERTARQRTGIMAEIEKLEANRLAALEAEKLYQQFEVSSARFYMDEKAFMPSDKRVFELTVKNGTNAAVKQAYFEGRLTVPGRSEPVHVEVLSKFLLKPIEPGASATWTFHPDFHSKWGRVTPPEDAVFTVRVTRLDGADNKPLIDASFTQRDAERLAKLKAEYGVPERTASK